MTHLLDTQAFLWFALNDSRLSALAQSRIADPANELLLSAASYWELAIKISIGKYGLNEDFTTFMERQIADNELTVLPVALNHAAVVAQLPLHHRDPFDRLLIAQAMVEQVPVLSADPAFDAYPIVRVW